MGELSIGGGLSNLGNTCFFNATLQSILHTPPLAALLSAHRHSPTCPSRHSKHWCVFCELEAVFTSTRSARSYSPSNMINHLKSIFKKFKLGRQEDSHQFLRYLVEGMQDSETGKLGKDREANEQTIRKTLTFGVFGGVNKTCVECLSCGHQSVTSQRYYDFNIGKECQRSNSLLQGVGSFFAVEKLEGNNKYLCEKCKQRSNARKRFLLGSVPKVVTFQLKRFTNAMRKIGKFMQYPLTIDLGKYLENPRKLVLKLYAVIVHAGGSSYSGHYYAFVRIGESWYKMDDSYVSKCTAETAMGQNAYILFYEKIFEEEETIKNKEKDEKVGKEKEVKDLGKAKDSDKKTEDTKTKNKLFSSEHPLPADKSNPNPNITVKLFKAPEQPQPQQPTSPKEPSPSLQVEHDSDIQIPSLLPRRRSKQQLQSSLPYQQLILRTFEKIQDLVSKMPRTRPRNRSQRQLYDLRKYETFMQKRRKIG